MQKVLYGFLLAAELFFGLIMMGLVYSNIGWGACAVTLAVTAALMIPLIVLLKREQDAPSRKKTLRQIALVALIPAAAGVILAVYVLVSMMIYFG